MSYLVSVNCIKSMRIVAASQLLVASDTFMEQKSILIPRCFTVLISLGRASMERIWSEASIDRRSKSDNNHLYTSGDLPVIAGAS